ncbi:AraC family transcriptional regulator of adaptative response / DNA-3-methyladenine glycosylase II [Deinobacterium chartae]|uniref:DNA-3-methyladenine glycosylase II n=1 Tax=Deinobacterium chartae TaxID=521158 RepID=A0A841I2W9_9DEIO|nr:Ada metal-binding domain-containing protein [Deinobacterium chartae]MBB6098760.1 AraC family transcriptional regulator of adaptative response / DNA-3-methyladenine glycosylase II [Deinobacterium chartae]
MALSRETMLARMLASDATCDGRFITGVLSTGIYCLPSCRARKPRPENVRFFDGPADARAAGLRPCKRCRPDDFYAGRDDGEVLIERLAERVRRQPGTFRDVGALAAAAEVSARKLHELFRHHYHTTPAEFLARSRVAAAHGALLGETRSIAEIAFEVGFESLSAFGENFRRHSAMTAQAYRRLGDPDGFELTLPDDYPLTSVLRYLGRDPHSLSECVRGHRYRVALRLRTLTVTAHLQFLPGRVRCRLEAARPPGPADLLEVHGRLLKLLGLQHSPRHFEAQLSGDPALADLLTGQRGLRMLLVPDLWDALVWAIAGQQVTVTFACTLRRRLTERWGERQPSGLYAPPAPQALARLEGADLLPLGFTRARADYLLVAARAVTDNSLPLEDLAVRSATRIERTLRAVRGIGPWSSHYLMMRGYGLLDCVPLGDTGLLEGLRRFFALTERPSRAETLRLMDRFSPYRSLATFHLWHRQGLNA